MSELLAVGDTVDLTNCDREPIRVPGAVQPYGVLVAMTEPDLVIRQVSANSVDLLGRAPEALLGARFPDVVLGEIGEALLAAADTGGDPAEHFPLSTTILLGGVELPVDVVMHRSGGMLVVEVEPGLGPMSFDRTYRTTRQAVSRINRTSEPAELLNVAAEEVRRLTGFDRVMIYRFDASWNGEVVAEDRTEGLNSFFGLRYPASDIPAQARELYRTSWLRVIPDVLYTPAALVPVDNPTTGEPLDLGQASLRSVSPMHVEYLTNMGVRASMSVSLIDQGQLWGLIVCHHYAGAHRPPYEVRAAAEFLGQALSLRLVSAFSAAEVNVALVARSVLAALTAQIAGEQDPAAHSLVAGATTRFDLVPAGAVAVSLDGERAGAGDLPDPAVVAALFAYAEAAAQDVLAIDSVPLTVPALAEHKDRACGALIVRLSPGQLAMWLRPEQVRTVDWGGDPHNKAIAAREGAAVLMSPRRSFERWQETVRLRSEPWTVSQVELAGDLRHNLLEAMYGRARRLATVAETLQRSLLPDSLPTLPGWSVCAEYSPSAGGEVGGDWYDVLTLPSGDLACVLGDVAGHGVTAAGTMGQLRHGLRAYLMEDQSPASVLVRLSRLVGHLLPDALATATVAVIEPRTGVTRIASAGHPPAALVPRQGGSSLLPIDPWPPLGAVSDDKLGPPVVTETTLAPGESLLLYSDGVIERRAESLDVGLGRLVAVASASVDPAQLCAALMSVCRDPDGEDDATVLVLARELRAVRQP